MPRVDNDVAALVKAVSALPTPIARAERLLTGLGMLMQDAVDDALTTSATPAGLMPITNLMTAMNKQTGKLCAALNSDTKA